MTKMFAAYLIVAKYRAEKAQARYKALLESCDHFYENGQSAVDEGSCNLCKQRMVNDGP